MECFQSARQTQGLGLFRQWKDYTEALMLAAESLIVILIPPPDRDQPIHETEDSLKWCFQQMCSLFGPWILPPGGVCPPWTADDSSEATVCLRHFTSAACTLQRSFESAPLFSSDVFIESIGCGVSDRLPPGYQTLLILFWDFYREKLSLLKKGGEHVQDSYQRSFLRLSWTKFWPHLSAMHSMAEVRRIPSRLLRCKV